jgi:hypothetical protein
MTLVYLSLILTYALIKLTHMATHADATVANVVLPDYFNAEFSYVFGYDSFAFGISGF